METNEIKEKAPREKKPMGKKTKIALLLGLLVVVLAGAGGFAYFKFFAKPSNVCNIIDVYAGDVSWDECSQKEKVGIPGIVEVPTLYCTSVDFKNSLTFNPLSDEEFSLGFSVENVKKIKPSDVTFTWNGVGNIPTAFFIHEDVTVDFSPKSTLPEAESSRYMDINVNVRPVFDNAVAEGSIIINNSVDSEYKQKVTIYKLETDGTRTGIYQSAVLNPGEMVNGAKLSATLEKGSYNCEADVEALNAADEVVATYTVPMIVTVKE